MKIKFIKNKKRTEFVTRAVWANSSDKLLIALLQTNRGGNRDYLVDMLSCNLHQCQFLFQFNYAS